jgi:rRNA maturation endonuclease Nob1
MLSRMHLDGMHEFDEYMKKIGCLYFCKNCARSFGSRQTDTCKFCGSEVTELNGHKKQLYRFYCPVCYKSTVSNNTIINCPKCGNKYLHSYPIDKMWKREFFSMRKQQIFGNIRKALSSIRRK